MSLYNHENDKNFLNSEKTKVWQAYGGTGYIAGGNRQPLWKTLWHLLRKLNMLTIQPGNCTLGHLSQKNENFQAHKNLHTNIHSSFILNSQKLEKLLCSSTGE